MLPRSNKWPLYEHSIHPVRWMWGGGKLLHHRSKFQKRDELLLARGDTWCCQGATTRPSVRVGANQPVHRFLEGKGLDIQQGTSVWVGSPKSQREHVVHPVRWMWEGGKLLHDCSKFRKRDELLPARGDSSSCQGATTGPTVGMLYIQSSEVTTVHSGEQGWIIMRDRKECVWERRRRERESHRPSKVFTVRQVLGSFGEAPVPSHPF